MSKKHFGTDGVRGIANEKISPELAFNIGQAAGRWLVESGGIRRAVIGRDTRKSGPMLGASLASGLCSVGVDVVALGVVPTGCVSFASRTGDYGLGAVISASHNPAPDNGIKLMGHDGRKLQDSVEDTIESLMESAGEGRPTGAGVGWLESGSQDIERYVEFLLKIVPERLDGLSIAVDCSQGAAVGLAPRVFKELGASIVCTGDSPNGVNINEHCGATSPETIQAMTKEGGFDFGVAFDGDADRAVFADEKGRLINGDRTMAIWCAHWSEEGGLSPAIVVGTVMSNMGFEKYMQGRGIRLERTPVGDKHVAARLTETGAKVGGEQSGHVIFPDHGPTGDGLVTALELARVIKREGRSASEFYGDFENWPQLLVNVTVSDQNAFASNPTVASAIATAETTVAGRGRVVVRASGTQPMVRVMVEADDESVRDQAAQSIVSALESELSGKVYSRVDLTHALGD